MDGSVANESAVIIEALQRCKNGAMPDLQDGQRVEVQGSTATYTLERRGNVCSCTCPAWRNQSAPPERRSCKHLRAYLGEAAAPIRIAPRPAWVPQVREDREVRARRRAALARVVASFPAVYDRMLRVYGLRMPRHLAYAIGWWEGLTREELDEAWAYVGTGPCGIADWFAPGGLELRVTPGLDARLHYRYRRDPPEFVSVFGGNSDGSHWGLWYDDPAELPRVIAHNWARDSAETYPRKPTLLGTLREDLFRDRIAPESLSELRHFGAIAGWLDEVHAQELEAYRAEAIAPLPGRADILGGMGPWIPGWTLPAALADRARHELYRAGAPAVAEWIAEARATLAAEPGRALAIGRELHWLDADAFRAAGSELLVDAYRALGRDALAEIARVHAAHRDLPSVDVHEPPAPTPLAEAIARGDREAVAALLTEPAPREALEALVTPDLAMLDTLLAAPGVHAGVEDAQLHHLDQLAFWRDHGDATYAEARAPHRSALFHLLDRCGCGGRALEAALACEEAGVLARVLQAVDLAWRSERGRSVLHVACRGGSATAVEALLARGADVHAKDRDGELPYDAVRDAWEAHRAAAARIYELLREAGGAPAPAAPAAPAGTWTAGTAVAHAKFGAGVVQSAMGTGADAKLVIRFADGVKTLLAKFVTRT